MSRVIDVGGDEWEVRSGVHAPHPGVGVLLFFPANSQRGYRVVELPLSRLARDGTLDGFTDQDLADLFARSNAMDFAHDRGTDGGQTSERILRLPNVGAV